MVFIVIWKVISGKESFKNITLQIFQRFLVRQDYDTNFAIFFNHYFLSMSKVALFSFTPKQMSRGWNVSAHAPTSIPTPPSPGIQSNTNREELIDILLTTQKISLAVPYFIIEPVALVLNFLLLAIICKREKHLRKVNANSPFQHLNRSHLRTYFFLRHLVYSDLLTCFVAIPFDALEIYRLEFRRSRQYCAASKYVRFVALCTSFYILVVTNFERFWSITFPFRLLSVRTVLYMIRGAWLAAFVINIPFLFLYHSRVEYMFDNDRYFVRVCVAEPDTKGKVARAYLGVAFLIPVIVIVVLSGLTMYRVVRVGKEYNQKSPKYVTAQADSDRGIRRVALASFYITAGFCACASPAGFYYLIIAGIGRPEFPTSYLIGRSIVIVANASAAVNPIVTILCFPAIRERSKLFFGLGAKRSYNVRESVRRLNEEDGNGVELLAVKIRSSFRKVRDILIGCSEENGTQSTVDATKVNEAVEYSDCQRKFVEDTLTSVIERTSNECRQLQVQGAEI